jgi:hypothetical protein
MLLIISYHHSLPQPRTTRSPQFPGDASGELVGLKHKSVRFLPHVEFGEVTHSPSPREPPTFFVASALAPRN